jgi:hypothetical protein
MSREFSSTPPATAEVRPRRARWVNRLLALAAVICFGIGWVGVILPGLPTTIFWIFAAMLATRSCPDLQRRIYAAGRIGRSVRLYIEQHAMTPRTKCGALIGMTAGVSISVVLLSLATTPVWVISLIISAGLIGAVYITWGVDTARW